MIIPLNQINLELSGVQTGYFLFGLFSGNVRPGIKTSRLRLVDELS